MTHRELLISMSVELESDKSWPWMIDVEDFRGKHIAMSEQYKLMELSEAKFMFICQLSA
jgi:hypothetical protein